MVDLSLREPRLSHRRVYPPLLMRFVPFNPSHCIGFLVGALQTTAKRGLRVRQQVEQRDSE